MPLSEEEPGGPRTSHRRCPGAGQICHTGYGAAEDRVETALVVLTPEPERMRPLAQSQPGQGRVGAEIPAGPDQPGHVRGSRDLHDATRLLDPADQSHWGRAGRRE